MRDPRAFTLMEVVILVVFMGIMAGLTLPRLGTMVGATRCRDIDSNLKSIQAAQRIYFTKMGAYCWSTTTPACGTTDQINASLGLSISNTNHFECILGSGCRGYEKATIAQSAWWRQIADTRSTPVCGANPCPATCP